MGWGEWGQKGQRTWNGGADSPQSPYRPSTTLGLGGVHAYASIHSINTGAPHRLEPTGASVGTKSLGQM